MFRLLFRLFLPIIEEAPIEKGEKDGGEKAPPKPCPRERRFHQRADVVNVRPIFRGGQD